MSRLPTVGSDNDSWGTILNDFLQQTLASDGTLITTATNSYTGTSNTNLANSSRPGLVQLAGDLSVPVAAPKVVGLQGFAVSSTTPTDGQVLTWNSSGSAWQPATPSAGGGGVTRAQAFAFASMRI
jgi:hypothetical protein